MASVLVPSRAVHQGRFAFLLEPEEVLPAAVALDEPTGEEVCDAFCDAMDGLTAEIAKFNNPKVIKKLVNLLAPSRRKAVARG